MNEGLAKVAEILAGTLKDDNELRKQAEKDLLALNQNPLEFFANLIQIIVANHPEISNQLKNAAALAVKRLIKELSDGLKKTEERMHFVTHIFSALIANGLDNTLRGSLGYALVPLFSNQAEVLSSFLPLLNSAMTSESSSLFGSLRAIKSIYGGFVMNPILFPFLKRIMPGLIQIATKSVISFNKALLDQNQIVALESIEIISEWSSTMNTVFEYFDITCKDNLTEIKNYSELSDVFKEIIMIVLPDSGVSQPSLINVSPSQISIKLNQAKTQLFQGINIIVQYLMENRKRIAEIENKDKLLTPVGLDLPESPFLTLINELLHPLTTSLQVIINTLDMNQLIEFEYVSEIFIEIILLIQKSCTDNRFILFFNDNYPAIIVNICLPLIKCTQLDMETFEESPEEFVSLSADVCERQESETVKSTSASLLETICNKIDGSLKFLLAFCQKLIYSIVKFEPLNNTAMFLPFLNSEFFKSSDELKVETALLSFCIVSFMVVKRPDLVKEMEKFLTELLDSLFFSGTGLIKNRLCMVVHYYCEHIFQDEEESFKALLLVVLDFCDPNKVKIPSVNFQASETLSHMLQDEEVIARIYQYLPELITSLISLIDYQDSKPFFEAFQEIITNNTNLMIPHIHQLVPSLINKVIKEVELKKNKKAKTSIVILKCWNIIRHLLECKSLSVENVLELEKMFLPLFKYIEDPKSIEFDDDIILFEVSVMRRCELVTEIGWNIFSQLNKVQEKYENTFVQLFQLLNCYIVYGKQVLVSNPEMLKNICEMSGKCLFAVYKNKINEAANAEGALIFHQILFTFLGHIDELVPTILGYAVLKLSTIIKQDFLKSRILGIILAAFAYNYNLTSRVLNTSFLNTGDSYMKFVLTEIMSNTQVFKHPYDKKVAVKGLINFFLHAEPQDKLIIFQILIEILSTSWKDLISLAPGFKINEKELNLKESFKDFNSEELEANLALTTFINPLSEFDDFETFREMVKSFQADDLNTIIKSLNKVQVEKLMNVLKSKKVQIGNTPDQTDVRRLVMPKYYSHK